MYGDGSGTFNETFRPSQQSAIWAEANMPEQIRRRLLHELERHFAVITFRLMHETPNKHSSGATRS
jgi:hypothetical protein